MKRVKFVLLYLRLNPIMRKHKITTSFLMAIAMSLLPCSADAVEIKSASAGLVGDRIAEFVPEGYSATTTPSLILKEEPTLQGELPGDWAVKPVFDLTDGKASAEIFLDGDISLYGGGEVTGPLLRNGKKIKLWNTDTGAYGVDGGSRLYQSHPWVMGVRPDGSAFGVIFDTSWKAELTTASDKITFNTEGTPFRVYVIDRSTPQEVLGGLAELTGTMEMPPLWALGYHQCRFSYGSEAVVTNIADNFRSRNIPCDAIWMDIDYMDGYRIFTFNKNNFPNPKALNESLHQKGFRAVYMIDPGAKVDDNYDVYRSGTANDVWVKRPDGSVYEGKVWPGYCAFPDFTMPDTRKWWANLYEDFLSNGIDGVWNDMNEPAVTDDDIPQADRIGTMPYDTPHRGGGDLPAGTHMLYHNAYGRLMVEATRDGVMAHYPDRRPFVLTRANILGGHRYAATWTGDNWAGWDHLKLSVPMSLTLGLSGQPFSGPDIGGFLNNTEPDLWANWIGFGVFLPFVRGHACAGTNNKEPWAFGEEIEASSKMAIERRYRLLPYFYTQFRNAHVTGIPVMQPVFFADPADMSLRSEQQSFLVGSDLMVIPAFASDVVMPSGIWETMSVVPGDLDDQYQAELKIKGGSIVPAGRVIQSTTESMYEPLTLFVCLDENGTATGTLYHDAGEGWGFRNGDYSLLTFSANRDGNTVTIKCTGREGNRDVSKEIDKMRVELLLDGKTYRGDGTLADGATVRISDLYLIGSATPAGWELDNVIAMENQNPGVYSWTGELKKNDEFKFLAEKNWSLSYTSQIAEPGNTVLTPGTGCQLYEKKENKGNDNKFTVAENGVYTLTADLNNMTVTASLDVLYPDLYIVGNGCGAGSETSKAIKLERVNQRKYVLTTELVKDGNFRFLTSGNWYPTYTAVAKDQPATIGSYELAYYENQPEGEPAFKVAESGEYVINVDLDAMTMNLNRDMSNATIKIVGDAAACGWDTKNAIALDADGDNRFSITIDLQGGKRFRFLTSDGWYPTYTCADDNHEASNGEHDLVYFHTTPAGEPAFKTKEGGRYQISLDLTAMKMSVKNTTEHLYIVGNGCAAGWDPNKAMMMTPNGDGTFTWEGALDAAGEFKFLPERSWAMSYTCETNTPGNKTVEPGVSYQLYPKAEHEGSDNKFVIAQSGYYKVTVDLLNMTMICTLQEQAINLRMVGDGCAAGWDTNSAIALTPQGNGIYTVTTTLKSGGNFRFITTDGWYPTYTAVEANQKVGEGTYAMKYYETQPAGEPSFKVETGGNYTVEVNVEALTMKLTYNKQDVYVIGNALDALDGNWDYGRAKPMDFDAASQLYTWTGKLYARTEGGSTAEFKFLKSNSGWDGYVSATSGNVTITSGDTYPIRESNGNPDSKFIVPDDDDYVLTVSLADMNMQIVRLSESGIAAIGGDDVRVDVVGRKIMVESAQPVAVTICNVAGMVVTHDRTSKASVDVAPGLYIIKAGSKTTKVSVH